MTKIKTKKVIIFIVEGISDKIALENIVTKIMLKYNKIKFKITKGDITSNNLVNIKNIENKIYDYVKRVVTDAHIKFTDIEEVIHIIDTDGTFIDDKNIRPNKSNRLMYFLDHIETSNVGNMIKRNREKSEKIEYIIKHDKVKKIPYACYYMSSNLDHVLYNKMNVKKEDKEKMATEFAISYEGREEKFIDFLNGEISENIPNNYFQSWQYIKQSTNSLNRHCNLNLFFKRYF